MADQQEFLVNARLECLRIATSLNRDLAEWSTIDLAQKLSEFVINGNNLYLSPPPEDCKFKEENTHTQKFVLDVSDIEPKLDALQAKVKSITVDVSQLIDKINVVGNITDEDLSKKIQVFKINIKEINAKDQTVQDVIKEVVKIIIS